MIYCEHCKHYVSRGFLEKHKKTKKHQRPKIYLDQN